MTLHLNAPRPIFENRLDAGRQLAVRLQEYRNTAAIVLAIPNGGVPVGLEVATALKTEFDVIISRKIPLPFNPEAGFGAIADDGTMILNDEMVSHYGLSEEQINYEAIRVRAEIKKRSMLYRGDRSLAAVLGKTVIIVDDGLASGYTMMAAVESVRRRRPREIIAAVPVASETAVRQVEKAADKVVACATGALRRFAIADFYKSWHDLRDSDVVRAIDRWRFETLRGGQ